MADVDLESNFKRVLEKIRKDEAHLSDVTDSDAPVSGGRGVKTAKVTSINLFQQPEAHPVVLDLALLRKYGADWMQWEPETLVWRIPQDFHTTDVSDLNLDKIQAMKTLHYNDNFWTQWEVFNWCLQPLNNMFPNFQIMQVPSTAQILVALSTAAKVRADVVWSGEVRAFMEAACRFDGIFCPPAPLDFIDISPDHDLIDCASVREKWARVRRVGKAPTKDTIVDEQLRRMLDAYNFLLADRDRLQSQLSLVLNG
jgi:hypothetical protein